MTTLTVKIWRGDHKGRFETYAIPARESQTVLDVVTYVQREIDPDLSYRFACRVGMCGSCAMTVNGRARWTCRTHVNKVTQNGELTIAPLKNLPVIRDLAVDLAPFFEKWQHANARFSGNSTRNEAVAPINPETPARRAASAAIECINCAVCYASCRTVTARADYVGPAALNRVWSLVNDEKHADQPGLRRAASADGGCYSCHTHGTCSTNCPVSLDPAGSIASLKRHLQHTSHLT